MEILEGLSRLENQRLREMEMTVDFGDVIKTYQEDELSILELAYATSIHKSQGAEFPIVIIGTYLLFGRC